MDDGGGPNGRSRKKKCTKFCCFGLFEKCKVSYFYFSGERPQLLHRPTTKEDHRVGTLPFRYMADEACASFGWQNDRICFAQVSLSPYFASRALRTIFALGKKVAENGNFWHGGKCSSVLPLHFGLLPQNANKAAVGWSIINGGKVGTGKITGY